MKCPNCPHVFTRAELASALGSIPSNKRNEAARKNGRQPVKPGSKPRGRPRKDVDTSAPLMKAFSTLLRNDKTEGNK